MSAVLINPVLNCASTLSYVHTAAFTRDPVNPWRTESYGLFVRGQVAGYFLRWEGHTFYVVFREHSAQAFTFIQHGESLKTKTLPLPPRLYNLSIWQRR